MVNYNEALLDIGAKIMKWLYCVGFDFVHRS